MFTQQRALSARKFVVVGVALCALAGLSAAPQAYAQADPIVLTFSTVGDSRQDPVPSKVDPTANPVSNQDKQWLQNTKAFSRILRSIQSQKPSMLFFNGDMIMGYGKAAIPDAWPTTTPTISEAVNNDLVKFYTQYAFWRGMVAPVMETGTYIVPVAGNHEVQCNSANFAGSHLSATCPSGKKALVENENAWAANMGDLILDNTRLANMFGAQAPVNTSFSTGVDDSLATDQSKLTYSFDFKGVHFVVINTDPAGRDNTAPTEWLKKDLALAQSRGIKRHFIFGHKPAYTYDYAAAPTAAVTGAGLDASSSTIPLRNAFWDVVEQYGATYFAGHEHIYNVMQPRAATGGKAYQVIVGSGGSPFDAKITDTTKSAYDRYYAWATVNVYQSGKVVINAYGFDAFYGPTVLLQSITLAP